MITETIKNLVKRKKKEKETLELFCSDCGMHQTLRGTPIRVTAMKKEFKRLHDHKTKFDKIFDRAKGVSKMELLLLLVILLLIFGGGFLLSLFKFGVLIIVAYIIISAVLSFIGYNKWRQRG